MKEIEKAIEKLKSLKGICLYANEGQRPPLEAIEIAKIYDLAIQALEKQLNDRWIPVSERLPEESSYILVTFDDGFVASVYYEDDFGLWYGSGEPIAWKPLPEPYKEG